MLPTPTISQLREGYIRAPPGPKALDVMYFIPRERREMRIEPFIKGGPPISTVADVT